ncbi:MAG: zf-HC2 domain-containing protein [Myxococcaceae bacterium]
MRPQVPTHPDDDRLLELAYGEVPAAEARALRTHVDGCPRCRTVLDGIAEVRTAFRSIPSEPAPDRGLDSLLAYGEQAAARARSRRGGLRILGVLSAVAGLALVWLVLPPSNRQIAGEAQAPAARPSDALARADTERPPAQGDLAKDEASEKGTPAPPAGAKQKVLVTPESIAPARRAADIVKRDAPAEHKALAQTPAVARAETAQMDRGDAKANTSSGALAAAGARTSGAAGAGAMAMKKSEAGADVPADKERSSPSKPAASPPAAVSEEARAREVAKVAAPPLGGSLASADAMASKAQPQAMMRVGAGSPEQQARLAEIQRKLVSARGDQRKALLMEQCELEASLQRGPDAVLTCSTVTREFPGTPEATRASEISRGFSVQLPVQTDER